MLKRIMMGAIAGLLLVASSARADEKMSDVEAYVAIIPVMYKVADDNPAQARTRLRDFCDKVVMGKYRDYNDGERRQVECKSMTYQLFLSFKRSNGGIVSVVSWYKPARWNETILAINTLTKTAWVKRDGDPVWFGPKDKDGWWYEFGATRHRGGTMLVYGWNNKPR